MTAVIYARYSSDNQREESIEGQIRECTAYAEKNGITVIKHYIDRAFSAKTDNRPEFQQMIKDSGKKLFDVVLVWKFDRFARNRFDSANYKMILKKNGVHLISVMEPIAEGSQGILVETLLEGMAEYYSAELSEKVIRGQTENALKGKCTGGTGTIGYKIDEDKFYHLDPLTSPLVLEAFQRYDNGEKMVEIVNFLNDKGVRNMQGGKMTHSSVNTMLKNRRYIGELSFRDIVVPDAIPAIVPKDLFDRVQKRMDKNKRAPACGKADEEYLLTTKLFCGKCGALMFGESGTSATGRTYYYYKCANVKRRKGCNKKTVQKEWLEDLVVRETMKLIQDDVVIDKIVQLVMDVQNQENTTIPLLEKQLREVNKKLDNLMKAIEDGLYTRTTKERLEALEIQKDELTAKIADEKLKKPSFNENFIRFWLMKFRKFDISQKKQRKALIEIFVNAIFLYDDRMLITFNYKDGTQTVRFEDTLTADSAEEKSSDLSSSAGGSGLFFSFSFVRVTLFIGIVDGHRHILAGILIDLLAGVQHTILKEVPCFFGTALKAVGRCHQFFRLGHQHGTEQFGVSFFEGLPHPDVEEIGQVCIADVVIIGRIGGHHNIPQAAVTLCIKLTNLTETLSRKFYNTLCYPVQHIIKATRRIAEWICFRIVPYHGNCLTTKRISQTFARRIPTTN